MSGDYIWITKNGNHIKIKNNQSPMDAFIRQSIKKPKKITKQEYARLCNVINTYPKKWEKGLNSQIIDNKIYIFTYKGYNNFEIVKIYKYKE